MTSRLLASGTIIQRLINEALQSALYARTALSDTEIVETILLQPGMFRKVSRTHAFISPSMLVCLLRATGNLSGDEEQTLTALLGMPEPERLYEKHPNLREIELTVDTATAGELSSFYHKWAGNEVSMG
jgi:hypothetical protein